MEDSQLMSLYPAYPYMFMIVSTHTLLRHVTWRVRASGASSHDAMHKHPISSITSIPYLLVACTQSGTQK